jgi:hypothetical protein
MLASNDLVEQLGQVIFTFVWLLSREDLEHSDTKARTSKLSVLVWV